MPHPDSLDVLRNDLLSTEAQGPTSGQRRSVMLTLAHGRFTLGAASNATCSATFPKLKHKNRHLDRQNKLSQEKQHSCGTLAHRAEMQSQLSPAQGALPSLVPSWPGAAAHRRDRTCSDDNTSFPAGPPEGARSPLNRTCGRAHSRLGSTRTRRQGSVRGVS